MCFAIVFSYAFWLLLSMLFIAYAHALTWYAHDSNSRLAQGYVVELLGQQNKNYKIIVDSFTFVSCIELACSITPGTCSKDYVAWFVCVSVCLSVCYCASCNNFHSLTQTKVSRQPATVNWYSHFTPRGVPVFWYYNEYFVLILAYNAKDQHFSACFHLLSRQVLVERTASMWHTISNDIFG